MDIYYVPNQLMQILYYSDDNGIFSYCDNYSEEYEDKLKSYSQSELANQLFCLTQLYLNNDKFASKAYIKRLNPSYEIKTIEDTQEKYILFSANAIAYFGLPNINPKEEIETLFNFFHQIKFVYENFYEQFPNNMESLRMNIFNRSSSLFESLDFPMEKERTEEREWLDIQAKILLKTIKENSILTSWFKHTRRLLNAIGSHSWQNYNEESFFDRKENPLQKRWDERPEDFQNMITKNKKDKIQESIRLKNRFKNRFNK